MYLYIRLIMHVIYFDLKSSYYVFLRITQMLKAGSSMIFKKTRRF